MSSNDVTHCPVTQFRKVVLSRWYVDDGSIVEEGDLIAELTGYPDPKDSSEWNSKLACDTTVLTLDLTASSTGKVSQLVPLGATLIAKTPIYSIDLT